MTKAFDTIGQLLAILHFVGFDFSSFEMIQLFCTIKIANTLCEQSDVASGVTQELRV